MAKESEGEEESGGLEEGLGAAFDKLGGEEAAAGESSGIPSAALAALAGAAVGLGPVGVALAAAAGFIFGKG